MSETSTYKPVTMYGSNRSVVRMIATRLPINTGHRLFIQLPHVPGSNPTSPLNSLQGVFGYSEENTLASILRDPGLMWSKATQRFRLEPIFEEAVDEEGKKNDDLINEMQDGDLTMENENSEATSKRISSLEAELARLKSQIANYALNEMQTSEAPPPAPPPPPPPPPLPSVTNSSTQPSTSDRLHPMSSTDVNTTPQETHIDTPMSSVLKDIGSVKLRTVDVKRSPGGTPLRTKTHTQDPSTDDPAAIIAHALRKKFSHRIFQDSPDKENLDSSYNEFDSPGPSKVLFDSPTKINQ